MKANEIAKLFTTFIEEGTTPKGMKVHAFFHQLEASDKRLVANNIAKAYAAYVEEENEKEALRKQNRKEIAELKKKAKALGLKIVE
ncbi:MAG: hypothetical protein RL226_1935 [Bacteroidota bacterium]|jgi:hypothetical protein